MSNYTANYTATPFGQFGTSSGAEAIFLVFIVLIVSRRLYQGVKGQKLTNRIYLLPAIYILLTVFTLFTYSATLLEIAITIIAIPIGILAGLNFGSASQVYDVKGVTHYRRSPLIMAIWIAAYIARYGLEIAYPTVVIFIFIAGALLAFTSGMLLGETMHISRKFKAHRAGKNGR